MSISVNTNVSSMLIGNNLAAHSTDKTTAIERLSTGYRINSAKDDAANLAVSEAMESDIRGADASIRNAQIGSSLLSSADEALGQLTDIAQRMRELAVQASQDTYSEAERKAFTNEITALDKAFDDVLANTKFNGKDVFQADGTAKNIIVDADGDDSIDIASPLNGADYSGMVGDASTAVDTAANAAAFVNKMDTALDTLGQSRSTLGGLQSRLESAVTSLETQKVNTSAALSTIRDADVAQEASNMTKSQILEQVSASLLSQANQAPAIALSLI